MTPSWGAITITFLGHPAGFSGSYGKSMSANGQVVVGHGSTGGNQRALRWDAVSGWTDLGVLPGRVASNAMATNHDGSVVIGSAFSPGQSSLAFRWTQEHGMQSLGVLPGTLSSSAYAISADGSVIVGTCTVSATYRPFRWTAAGGMQEIGVLAGSTSITPYDISPDGSVITGAAVVDGTQYAFRWTESSGYELLSALPGWSLARGYGVSLAGTRVVGSSITGASSRATMWENDQTIDIGVVPGGSRGVLYAINDNGMVAVGADLTTVASATMWTHMDGFVNLNTYLPQRGVSLGEYLLINANDISADGTRAVGWATRPYGSSSAWLVTGIPAPGVTGVLVLGVVAIAGRRSRTPRLAYTRA
ncbi:MAG: hypothetical protein HBSAPP03_00740 [Phycisphaerae bacterium]|nr:MAG: hypothetical protein HBSAPP03_00740 [Phycisphaerae bacterium]